MSETNESVITVDVTHEEELAADGFDLFVHVRGLSLFTGSSAFEKAAEVKSLVSAVVAAGITRSDVALVGVHVDVESGLLSKSSSARYSLRIRSADCECLSRVLSSIASAKNVTVDSLDWRYPEGETAKQAWLRAAATKARGRAEAIADALGMMIHHVVRVTTPLGGTSPMHHQPRPSGIGYGSIPTKSLRGGGQVDLGLEVAPTKRVELDVRVELTARPRSDA